MQPAPLAPQQRRLHLQQCGARQQRAPAAAAAAAAPARASSGPRRQRGSVCRPAVERDLDWDPAVQRKGPLTAPPRGSPPPPPPPPPAPKPAWYEVPFASRRNIMATLLLGSAGMWVWNKKVLPPVAIGDPPPDFPFQLAGFTDVEPADFVYARTPGGNWIAAAQDEAGRMYVIDQAGDLFYDSGRPDIGLYALDPQGNLFNIYMEAGQRRITPVGNISQMTKFKVSEIAGLKLERDVTVVAMADGSALPLPPGTGAYDAQGRFMPPGEIIEGFSGPRQDNPFARLLGGRRGSGASASSSSSAGSVIGSGSGALGGSRYEVDPSDARPYGRQLYDQTLLDDPDLPGFQPALPQGFSLEELARQVEAEQQAKARRKRGLF